MIHAYTTLLLLAFSAVTFTNYSMRRYLICLSYIDSTTRPTAINTSVAAPTTPAYRYTSVYNTDADAPSVGYKIPIDNDGDSTLTFYSDTSTNVDNLTIFLAGSTTATGALC
jgi:hypothetical protein